MIHNGQSGGTYSFDGRLVLQRLDAGCYSHANRQQNHTSLAEPPMAAAVLAPGNSPFSAINIDAFRVSHGHAHDAHEELLSGRAKGLGATLTGELVSCTGCSMSKGRRTLVPK